MIREYMVKLGKYTSLATEDILKDEDKRLAIERSFQLVVDEAVDINSLLAYQIGNKVPDAYKSTFYEFVP